APACPACQRRSLVRVVRAATTPFEEGVGKNRTDPWCGGDRPRVAFRCGAPEPHTAARTRRGRCAAARRCTAAERSAAIQIAKVAIAELEQRPRDVLFEVLDARRTGNGEHHGRAFEQPRG